MAVVRSTAPHAAVGKHRRHSLSATQRPEGKGERGALGEGLFCVGACLYVCVQVSVL